MDMAMAHDTRELSSMLVVGVNDYPHLMDGWHERTVDARNGVVHRAGGPEARMQLALPAAGMEAAEGEAGRDPRRLHVLMSGPVGLMPGGRLLGTVTLGGVATHPLELDMDAWVVRVFDIPGECAGGRLEVVLRLPDAPSPDALLRNGDARRLGWYVSAAWVG